MKARLITIAIVALILIAVLAGCSIPPEHQPTPTPPPTQPSPSDQEEQRPEPDSAPAPKPDPAPQPPASPELLRPHGDSTSFLQPVFEWTPVEGATKYEYILAKDSALREIVIRNRIAITTLILPFDLDADVMYYWSVKVLEPTSGVPTTGTFRTAKLDPAKFILDSLTVTPRPDLGRYVAVISINIENIGGTAGVCEIESSVGDQVMLPTKVELQPGAKITKDLGSATTTLNYLHRDYWQGKEEQRVWVIKANTLSTVFEFESKPVSTPTPTPAPTPAPVPTPTPIPTVTPTSVPTTVLEIIRANASAKWGNDASMVQYEINKQVEAYIWIEQHGTYTDIAQSAKLAWGNDYAMVKYEYEKQLDAYLWIVQQSTYPDIMHAAQQKWGSDYAMVKYEYGKQLEAYLWINQQTAFPEIMQAAKLKWGNDYTMVEYEYKKQIASR